MSENIFLFLRKFWK